MSAVDLLKQATKQVCQEFGVPWTDAADDALSGSQIARVADVFADLVLAQHTAELEREAALMRARMERLEAERTTLVEAVCQRISHACGPNSVAEMVVRRDFLPERPCVVHVAPDDTEGGALWAWGNAL